MELAIKKVTALCSEERFESRQKSIQAEMRAAFDRQPSFVKKAVNLLVPQLNEANGMVESEKITEDVYFPTPPMRPKENEFIQQKINGYDCFERSKEKEDLTVEKNRLSLLLQCVCPFTLTNEQFKAFDEFMNPFWAYNNYTAKQTKNRDEVISLNNAIKWVLFGERLPESETINKREWEIANAIKEGLPEDYLNKNQLKLVIKDFLHSCANEKSATKVDVHEHRTRRGSVAGKVMISGLSCILGINEDAIYETGQNQRIESMMEVMDNICIEFNELISVDKEARSEGATLPWKTKQGYQRWKNQRLKKYHENLQKFYKLKQEFIDEDFDKIKNKDDVKSYINIIEGAIYGVQLWSAFITMRYDPNNKVETIESLYNQLINKSMEKISLTEMAGILENNWNIPNVEIDGKIKGLHNKSIEDINCDHSVIMGLKCFTPLKGTDHPDKKSERYDLQEAIEEFVANDQSSVLLIQGTSGSGKSLMGRHMEQVIWGKYKSGHGIPLFVSLSQNKGKTIDDILKAKGFTAEEINELKDNKVPFIFILDGYDELNEKKNMYEMMLLNRYSCQIIYTCRSQYVADIEVPVLFGKSNQGRRTIGQKVKLTFINPLDEISQQILIKKYLQLNDQNTESNIDSSETIMTQLNMSDELKNLTKEPFSLRMILDILPYLSEKYSNQMTRFQLYREFNDQWFKKENDRLNASGESLGYPYYRIFNLFNQYCIDLAYAMKEKNTVVMDMNHPEEWDEFFYDENVQKFKEKKIGLMGSPIRKIGNDMYTFIHKSFLEYFVTKKMVSEIERETKINKQMINKRLFVESDSGDVSIISFFNDYLKENDETILISDVLGDIYFSIF